ncbi:MAG: ATP-binding protein [Chloroflexi bacterium]|nr:ATP-binding protein [Chloroflexota bacterium]
MPAEAASAPDCPVCGGIGYVQDRVPYGHPDFGKIRPCQCQKNEAEEDRLARLRRYSNLGPLTRLTFEALNPLGRTQDTASQRLFQSAYRAGRAFAESPQGWLVLTGTSGCGKTHLAAAVINECLRQGRPAFFVTVPDLLDHLRATFAPDSQTPYDELFEQVRNAPLLALDDLGAHASTPWAQEKLFQVLNHRYHYQLPTVVTVSVPLSGLDERLRSRLTDSRLCQVLELERGRPAVRGLLGAPTPEQQREMTFDAFDLRGNRAISARQRDSLETALKAARELARDPAGQWLILQGKPGVGKTHLAVAIYTARAAQGQPAFFAFVPDLLDHLRYAFRPESTIAYDELFDQVKSAPLLIMDDLGSQRSTPWAEEKLYQIIAFRHSARLPTVITMGEQVELSAAVASRLKDERFVTYIEMDAPDYRDQAQRPRAPRRVQSSRP